jgi:predicted permease
LALELDGDSELAAGCVFWTTVASAVTVTATIFIVMVLGRY